jgi:outer membrane protein OmpA-like peptidoglycan-associated protein
MSRAADAGLNEAQDAHDDFDADPGAEAGGAPVAPVWAVFGDLMASLLGAFVLILVAALALQLAMAERLEAEVQQRRAEAQRNGALAQALAVPLAEGSVTLSGGRIGIRSSLLFAFNSAELQPEGHALLKGLAGTLTAYLQTTDEVLMVSGYTDDRAVRGGSDRFADNWELSAQRALTVTRALIDAGVPRASVFAAAFGAEQPVAPNTDAEGRALNRRVEIAPMPRARAAPAGVAASAASTASAPAR